MKSVINKYNKTYMQIINGYTREVVHAKIKTSHLGSIIAIWMLSGLSLD